MIEATFAEFLDACKDRLSEQQVRDLNPAASYFRLHKGYVGLFVKKDEGRRLLWISIMVGGMRDLWMLRQEIEEAGIYEVQATCRKGSVTETLAKYYGATVIETGDTYEDGDKILLCKCYPQQTQRFKKSKDKVLENV